MDDQVGVLDEARRHKTEPRQVETLESCFLRRIVDLVPPIGGHTSPDVAPAPEKSRGSFARRLEVLLRRPAFHYDTLRDALSSIALDW